MIRAASFFVLSMLLLVFACDDAEAPETTSRSTPAEEWSHNDNVDSTHCYPFRVFNDSAHVCIDYMQRARYMPTDLRVSVHRADSLVAQRRISAAELVQIPAVTEFSHSEQFAPDDLELRYLAYHSIRLETIFLRARLHNSVTNEVVYGRFALVFKPGRAGELYGWATDSIVVR